MAHGRKRSCLGGMLLGAFFMAVLAAILVWMAGDILFEPRRPMHMASAKASAWNWARLPALLAKAQGIHLTTDGSVFSRSFRVTFFGAPADIAAWVKSCPGVGDPDCKKEPLEGGGMRYVYPAGGGAAYAEIVHFPARGTVEIYTYWS
ncbi:hypothetical protein DES53_10222 [Roseimicrobium gellanilyticum]|uniref:Uncharacterized protein n=1 Tax=Roseimicrobium gellanilyticum TaxID=748857 RepID=A0A366HPS1_9BACT|nr:hypothetical protein [Roseimicrobium gellanilyticum]RBP45640.1 hypothetical protein DES53_10222 [Roseimicrobium gellanilyticum]